MTLGIAIPCHSSHINFINDILDKISQSTILPNQVSISVSSYDGNIELKNYKFELIITKTIERKNACENRNIAASKLSTDIISFIDCDDIPHIKRNEYVIESFRNGAVAVVHNYLQSNNLNTSFFNSSIGETLFYKDYIDTINDNCTFAFNSSNHKDYHCAHISVKKEIFETFKYDESIGYIPGEDGEYTKRIVKNGFKISYLENKLSLYNN